MESHPQVVIGVVCWIPDNIMLPELKRCLDSLVEFDVILVNGKWDDIKGDNPRSTLEAQIVIDSYANVTHILSPNKSEAHNRNIYLENTNADFLFWVDTDEYIEMPLGKEFFIRGIADLFKKDDYSSQVHSYVHQENGKINMGKQKRLIQYPNKMRHRDKHNKLYFGDKEILANEIKYHAPRGLIVHADKNFRTKEREQQMLNRIEGITV